MCLLINQSKGAKVSREKLQTAYEYNNDGVGYSYAFSGQLHIRKFRDFKEFYSHYKQDVKTFGQDSDFIIHFRLSTHGLSKGVFNVHPFKVSDNIVFAHNGVINKVEDDKKLSDTQVFNEKILKELPSDFISNKYFIDMIADFIGFNNKLVFLNSRGDSVIINENAGHNIKGVWYSNKSYEDYSCADPRFYGSYLGSTGQSSVWDIDEGTEPHCDWCWCVDSELNNVLYSDSEGEKQLIKLCDTCKRYK